MGQNHAWNLQTKDDITRISTICGLWTSGLFIFFYTPFLWYHFYKYYKQRHHIVFRKRKNVITHWAVFVFLFKLFFGAIMYHLYLLWGPSSLSYNIFRCIDDCLLMLIVYLWVWRFYILCYDINWTVSVLNYQWKVLLNASSPQQDWYLMHKKTYGSSTWVFMHCILPSILLSCVLLITNVVLQQCFAHNDEYIRRIMQHTINYIFEIIPFICLVVIFCKSKANMFDDQFFIIQELKYIFIALVVENTANILTFVCSILLWNNEVFARVVYPMAHYNFSFGPQFVACLISTQWVNGRVNSIVKFNQYELVRTHLSFGDESETSVQFLQIKHDHNDMMPFPTSMSVSATISGRYTGNKNKELFLKLLSKAQGFHAFILHLSSEFSLEMMLFLIEVNQFQNYIKKYCRYDLISDVPGSCLHEKMVLPLNIPLSEIVYGDGNRVSLDNISRIEKDVRLLRQLKRKAVKIFRKYIEPQSEFEVNISYHGRRELIKLMGHEAGVNAWIANSVRPASQFQQLLDLYEESCGEIFALMIDSFNRFKHTASYLQLKEFKIFN